MAVYYAEIERTDILTVRVEVEGDGPPTDEEAMAAAAYVDNHVSAHVGTEYVFHVEKVED